MELIKGGLYSISIIPENYYIFILDNDFDELFFYQIKARFNSLNDMIHYIEPDLACEEHDILRKNIVKIDKNKFIENYDGFLGVIEDWMIEELENIL